MRARVLVAGLMVLSTVAIAGPASAKADIVEANITGPGLRDGLRIETPDTGGLWESGIDVVGGLDDTRASSVARLGLTHGDLGPSYLVAYRFGPGRSSSGDLIRQYLYPYPEGGAVTHTPPGQALNIGIEMSFTAGWYRSPVGFLRYLVDHGLPEANPVATAQTPHKGPGQCRGQP